MTRVADNGLEMIVKNLSPKDTSNYTCRATNDGGEHAQNGTIVVECKCPCARGRGSSRMFYLSSSSILWCYVHCQNRKFITMCKWQKLTPMSLIGWFSVA